MDQLRPYLTPQNLALAGAAIVALIVLRGFFSGRAGPSYTVPARCGACGWVGSVSRFAAKCPRCAAAIDV